MVGRVEGKIACITGAASGLGRAAALALAREGAAVVATDLQADKGADLAGEIEQSTGELGFFSPHSWWPLFVGLSAATAAMGVAFGWWMFLIGVLALLLSVIGFVFEYYRGHYAH